MDDNYGELAQAVTEARKSHDPPPASRRPREAGGGTSRPRAEDAMSSLGSSSGVGRWGQSPSSAAFVHFRRPVGGVVPPAVGTAACLLSQTLISPGNMVAHGPTNNVQPGCPWLVELTREINCHRLPVGTRALGIKRPLREALAAARARKNEVKATSYKSSRAGWRWWACSFR